VVVVVDAAQVVELPQPPTQVDLVEVLAVALALLLVQPELQIKVTQVVIQPRMEWPVMPVVEVELQP
jgi:hypothetical protein